MLTRHVSCLFVAATAALSALSLFLALTGGGRIAIAGLTLSSRDWRRPAALATMLVVGRLLYLWRDRRRVGHLARGISEVAASGLGAISLLMLALGLRYLVKACGGLDSSGYVSAAALMTAGHL